MTKRTEQIDKLLDVRPRDYEGAINFAERRPVDEVEAAKIRPGLDATADQLEEYHRVETGRPVVRRRHR